jgi:tRNA G18 (ribose-2'-O)-methylase SpoU
MPRELVASIDDPRVAIYRDLPRSNLTRPSGFFIAEGHLLVQRLLASPFEVASILLDERFQDTLELPCPAETPVYVVPSPLINQIVGFRFHRGVLACGRRKPFQRLEELDFNGIQRRTVVVCVDVHDPENMGAILRTSAAFGVDLVVFTNQCADPFSRRVLRTSMGTVFKLPLVATNEIVADLRKLRTIHQVELAASILNETAESLDASPRPARLGLLFGNEGHGLPPHVAAECDRQVMIPMRLGTDSLNVSVAAGIFLYHFTR